MNCPHCGEEVELRKARYVDFAAKERKEQLKYERMARREQIKGLHKFGATVSEIAEVYGLSRQRVSQILKGM